MILSKNHRGFTLVEVILSIAIISIILIAMLSMFTGGITNIFLMGRKTEAVNIAQGFIESVYSQGVGQIDIIAGKYKSTKVDDISNLNGTLYNSNNPSGVTFHHISTGSNPKLTVLVFYDSGKHFVKLSSLMP